MIIRQSAISVDDGEVVCRPFWRMFYFICWNSEHLVSGNKKKSRKKNKDLNKGKVLLGTDMDAFIDVSLVMLQ